MQTHFGSIKQNHDGIQTSSSCCACLCTTAIIATLSLVAIEPLNAQVDDQSTIAQRLSQLELEISALHKTSEDEVTPMAWVTNEAAPRRALQAEVAAQSAHYQSLLSHAAVGDHTGYAKQGYFLTSDDGAFSLNVSFLVQVRHLLNQQEARAAADHETVAGFEQRRTRIYFSGLAGTPDLEYKTVISFSSSSGSASLSDCWIKWHLDDQITLQVGQFKAPFLHEELTSSSRQLAVDRSYVNALMSVKRTQGIGMTYRASSHLRFGAMLNDGVTLDPGGTNGANANTAFTSEGVEYAATARGDLLMAGEWSQFQDYTAWSDDDFGWRLGAATHWQESEVGTPSAETKAFLWTVDSTLEWPCLSLAGALVGAVIDTQAAGMPTYDQWGGTVQAGYHLVPDRLEIFGRYEWFEFDGATAASSASDFSAVTAGFNWFLLKHQQNAKFSMDVVWTLDPVPDKSSGVGLRADLSGADDQFVVRSQLSLRW